MTLMFGPSVYLSVRLLAVSVFSRSDICRGLALFIIDDRMIDARTVDLSVKEFVVATNGDDARPSAGIPSFYI